VDSTTYNIPFVVYNFSYLIKMKKIIFLTMFLLVCSIAFAQTQTQQRTQEQIQQRMQQAEQVMVQARNRTIYKPEQLWQIEKSGQIEKMQGLDNAYTNVKNGIAKEQIRNNMIRFQSRYNFTYR